MGKRKDWKIKYSYINLDQASLAGFLFLNMKYPQLPSKPYPPYKPIPPTQKIERKKILGTQTSQEDSAFTISSFTDYIKTTFPDIDVDKVQISFEIDKEHGYYDDVYTHLSIHYFIIELIDNPQYDKLFKHYQTKLVEYNRDTIKYKKDLEKFHKDEKQYEEDLEIYQVENAKAILAKHEKKKEKSKK